EYLDVRLLQDVVGIDASGQVRGGSPGDGSMDARMVRRQQQLEGGRIACDGASDQLIFARGMAHGASFQWCLAMLRVTQLAISSAFAAVTSSGARATRSVEGAPERQKFSPISWSAIGGFDV